MQTTTQGQEMGPNETTSGTGTGGRRPRWTEKEDLFLKEARKSGISKREIIEKYKLAFPLAGRPDAGIMARIPSYDRANGIDRTREEMDEMEDRLTTPEERTLGAAVSDIFDIVQSMGGPADQARILNSVAVLCGLGGALVGPAAPVAELVPRGQNNNRREQPANASMQSTGTDPRS